MRANESWVRLLSATVPMRGGFGLLTVFVLVKENSGHFAGDNPACQETDWDGRRSRALLTAQADDRNDIIKYTQSYKEC